MLRQRVIKTARDKKDCMNQQRSLSFIVQLLLLLCGLVCIITTSLVIMALRPSLPKAVEARSFVLRDSLGRVRAELSVDAAGNAALFFVDSLGQKKAVLK